MKPISSLLLAILLLCSSCGPAGSPDEEIRRVVAAAEEAAEERKTGGIKELISENYTDDRRRTKPDLVRVAAGYFLRHKRIHLFSRVAEIDFPEPDRALVVVYVAMAGLPVQDAESLFRIDADLYRFDLQLVREDGDWLVTRAGWRPALPEDFLEEDDPGGDPGEK